MPKVHGIISIIFKFISMAVALDAFDSPGCQYFRDALRLAVTALRLHPPHGLMHVIHHGMSIAYLAHVGIAHMAGKSIVYYYK